MAVHPNSLANLRMIEPGRSGNPAGRKTAGASIREWMNSLADDSAIELRKIVTDEREPTSMRIAAVNLLDAATPNGDLADFEPFLLDQQTLKQLRKAGADTRLIKKASIRHGKEGEKTMSIELRTNDGQSADRVMDRTEGKPVQRVEVAQVPRHPSECEADAASIRQQMAAFLAANPDLVIDVQPAESPSPPLLPAA